MPYPQGLGRHPIPPPRRPRAAATRNAPPTQQQPPAELVAALHGNTALAVYAVAAAAAKPWGTSHPITWAMDTGRITAASAVEWATHLATDPDITLPILAALEPVLTPQLRNVVDALAATDPDEDELAEFDHLQPPNMRVQQPEGEDGSEFDHLYPPHMRHARQDDALDPELAEFDALYPPTRRLGPDAYGLTDGEYRARLGGH